MIKYLSIFLILTWLSIGLECTAQVQLILVKREKVILRLHPGDEFRYSLKGSSEIRRSYVDNVYDTAVLTGNNVIVPLYKIDRIYFQRTRFYNKVGGKFIGAGFMLFIADQFNTSVLQGEDFRVDNDIAVVSVAFVAAGLPMSLIRKKSQRIKRQYKLLPVQRSSVFYKE